MDFKELVATQTQTEYGRQFVFFKKSHRLIVVMSAHNQGERFMSIKSMYHSLNESLLFLNNPENSWYLDERGSYGKIIENIIEEHEFKEVLFYGSSMSGYSAILFALRFNGNALAVNPQINLDLTSDICWEELEGNINKIQTNKINLENYCLQHWKDSVIYILHGHNDLDRKNIDLFSTARANNKKLILQAIDSDGHENYIGRDMSAFSNIANLVFQFRQVSTFPDHKADSIISRQRRVADSLLNKKLDYKEPLWATRSMHETPGNIVHFSDIGLYDSNGNLTGCTCVYNGGEWELLSPNLTNANNLLSNSWSFNERSPRELKNNEFFNENWWARIDESSSAQVEISGDVLAINLEHTTTKNIYISSAPKVKNQMLSDTSRHLTFIADVLLDSGSCHITLGGRTSEGYFHNNSLTNSSTQWNKIIVSTEFCDIDFSHKDFIFCRMFFSNDLKPKKLLIKNPQLFEGYIPRHLKL